MTDSNSKDVRGSSSSEKNDNEEFSRSDEGSEEPDFVPKGKYGKDMVRDGDYWVLDVPMRSIDFTPFCLNEPISFNPIASSMGVIALWGLSIWCMVNPQHALTSLLGARSTVTQYFTCKFCCRP